MKWSSFESTDGLKIDWRNWDQVAVPGDVDADDPALDGQVGEVTSGKLNNVAQTKDGTQALLWTVLLRIRETPQHVILYFVHLIKTRS